MAVLSEGLIRQTTGAKNRSGLIWRAGTLSVLCFLLFSSPALANTGFTGTFALNPGDLNTRFSVRLLTGQTIGGRFETVSGTMVLDERRPERSSVRVTVDLTSVSTDNPRFNEFLKGPSMFDAGGNPTAEFVSTRVQRVGATRADVEGVLKLRGQSRPVKLTVDVEDTPSSRSIRFSAEGSFFRSLFGMNVGTPLYGDRVRLRIEGQGRRR